MDAQEYLEEMKVVQGNLLEYLDNESDNEELFQNLNQVFNDQKTRDSKYKLQSLLHLILKIVKNHQRLPNFFNKIEKTLLIFRKDMQQHFSNSEIFNIFQNNKRILLFLIKENLLIFDEYIAKKITLTGKYVRFNYPQYFQPELLPYLNKKWFPKYYEHYTHPRNMFVQELTKDLPENFEELRKIGENPDLICKLIREDNVKDFIVYVNKNNLSLDSFIKASIYETNSLLLNNNKKTNLINYSLFYGSVQIFNYLRANNVKLQPKSWIYSIHGQNAELIQILEEDHLSFSKGQNNEEEDENDYGDDDNDTEQNDDDDKQGIKELKEAIKCHHNDVVNYFINNYPINSNSKCILIQCLKSYNFAFLQINSFYESSFEYLCRYDHCALVDCFLKAKSIYLSMPIEKIIGERDLEILKNECYSYKSVLSQLKDYTDWSGNNIYDGRYQGKTPFLLAVEKENVEIVKLLIKYDINCINHSDFVCEYVPSEDNVQLHDKYKNTALSDNIANHCGVMILLYSKSALYLAVEKENIDIVKILMMNDKLDINNTNMQHIIGYADGRCNDEYNYTKKTAFFLAVEKENVEIIKFFLANKKLNINYLNTEKDIANGKYFENGMDLYKITKKTALYLSVENENIEIIKLLLENDKLDINVLNFESKKHLNHLNDTYEDEDEDEEEKVDDDTKIVHNITSLYLAVDKENFEIIKLLLMNDKININMLNTDEENKDITVLHLAAKKQNSEIISLLLKQQGIDANIKDRQGKTPIEYAQNKKLFE